jgi:hypothetical protein
MAEHDDDIPSIPALIRSVLDDARELIRDEVALARAELREEATVAKRVGIAFAAAAVLAIVGAVLFSIALGGAVADLLDMPAWAGYGIVAVLLAGSAYLLAGRGSTHLAKIGGLPRTRQSVRENMEWIRSRSSSR